MKPAIELRNLRGPINAQTDRAEVEVQRLIQRTNEVMAYAATQERIGAELWDDIGRIHEQLRQAVMRATKLGVRMEFRVDHHSYRMMPNIY